MSDKILEPTQVVNAIAILLSFYVGYKYGVKSLTTASSSDVSQKKEANYFSVNNNYKMLLVVRNDLKMGKGKVAAQCCHAAVGAYQKAVARIPAIVRCWESSGSAKIAVKVENQRELFQIKDVATSKGINTCLIRDAGRTQIAPNTATVLAIGPAAVEKIDEIARHLKLL